MSEENVPTIEVTIDGKKHTVPRPAGLVEQAQIDKDYLPRKTVNELYVLQTTLDERFKKWTPKEKAAEDQEVIAAVLKNHKPKDGDKGSDDLEAAKAKWKATDVDPLVEENNQLKSLLRGNAIRNGAGEFFDDKYTRPPREGEPSYMESLFGKYITYDKSLNYHVALDEKGNKIPAQNPTATRPYADAKEFFQSVAEQDAYKAFRKPKETNNSSGYNGTPGGGGDTDVSGFKPRSQMNDEEKLAAIKKLGHEGFMKIPLKSKS